jgi:hypothetical protein
MKHAVSSLDEKGACAVPCGGFVPVASVSHRLTGLVKRAFYVSPSGYGLVCRGLCTQGGALPLGELGAGSGQS